MLRYSTYAGAHQHVEIPKSKMGAEQRARLHKKGTSGSRAAGT